MALQTYDDVVAAISRWTGKDMSQDAPDLIRMFEAKVNRRLSDRNMEFAAEIVTDAGKGAYPLPPGFRGMRELTIPATYPRQVLKFLDATAMDTRWNQQYIDLPHNFTIEANMLRLAPVPDGPYTIRMTYYKGITPLQEASDPNGADKWLLLEHPDIYVYGALQHAQVRLQRDQRNPLFASEVERTMQEIHDQAEDSRYNAGPVTAEPEFYTP